MEADYSFAVDPLGRLMQITMSGFFSPADVVRFAEARAVAHDRLKCAPNQHLTLVDIRQMKIQSRETVEAFAGLLGNAEFHGRRIAFVVARSLARSQIQRSIEGRDAQLFMDREEALRWLMAGQPAPLVAPVLPATSYIAASAHG